MSAIWKDWTISCKGNVIHRFEYPECSGTVSFTNTKRMTSVGCTKSCSNILVAQCKMVPTSYYFTYLSLHIIIVCVRVRVCMHMFLPMYCDCTGALGIYLVKYQVHHTFLSPIAAVFYTTSTVLIHPTSEGWYPTTTQFPCPLL